GRSASWTPASTASAVSSSEQSTLECVSVASLFVPLPATPVEHGQAYRPPAYMFLRLRRARWKGWDFIEVAANMGSIWPEGSFLVAEFYNEEATIKLRFSMAALGRVMATVDHGNVPAPLLSIIRMPVIDDSMLAYRLTQTMTLPESKFTVGAPSTIDLNFHGRIPASLSPLLLPRINQSSSGAGELEQTPLAPPVDERRGLSLQVWQDPTCRFTMSLHLNLDLYGSVGRAVKAVDMSVVAFLFVSVMMVLAVQLKEWNSNVDDEAADQVGSGRALAESGSGDAQSETREQLFRRRLITTAVLFVVVGTLIPPQFAFLVAFILHIYVSADTGANQKTPQKAEMCWNLHQYQMTLLLLLSTLLPLTLPMLLIWIRNMSVLWFNPGSSDHNVMTAWRDCAVLVTWRHHCAKTSSRWLLR
ncbi:MAG: hypothetical protein BJ554DRAFT_7464, partial [Olpidium bornovanus]